MLLLTARQFGDDQGQEPKPPAEYRPSTSDRYVPSTYGNPHVSAMQLRLGPQIPHKTRECSLI